VIVDVLDVAVVKVAAPVGLTLEVSIVLVKLVVNELVFVEVVDVPINALTVVFSVEEVVGSVVSRILVVVILSMLSVVTKVLAVLLVRVELVVGIIAVVVV
jgi:hypothetical protein